MTTVKPLNWVLEDLGLWKAQTNLIACYSVWDCGDHWECSLLDGQFPSAEAAKSAAFADYSARIMSAIEPAGVKPLEDGQNYNCRCLHPSQCDNSCMSAIEPAGPQCCMCGKKGLSTVEGDGGSECELQDGRWVCSAECWDRAIEPAGVGVETREGELLHQCVGLMETLSEDLAEDDVNSIMMRAMVSQVRAARAISDKIGGKDE